MTAEHRTRSRLPDETIRRLQRVADRPEPMAPGYRILQCLGSGGMGVVWLAWDRRLQRRVALKVLDGDAAHGGLTDRLIREARVLARLEHPGIVPVHEVGRLADGRVYYVMKFIEGARLDHHLRRTPHAGARLRLMMQLCEPVAFAHSRNVVHRDLKPANVMVGAFGEVLVLDWGLARTGLHAPQTHPGERTGGGPPTSNTGGDRGGRATEDGTVLGTPGYMAPEWMRGDAGSADHRADIFSLGALLRDIVTWAADTDETPRRVPRPLAAIIGRAMAADPRERYASVDELRTEVARYLDGARVETHREVIWERVQRVVRRHSFVAGLVAAYACVRVFLHFLLRV